MKQPKYSINQEVFYMKGNKIHMEMVYGIIKEEESNGTYRYKLKGEYVPEHCVFEDVEALINTLRNNIQ